MTTTLVLGYPPSANTYKSRRVVQQPGKAPLVLDYLTAEAKQYFEAVQWLARAAGIHVPIPRPHGVAMQLDLYPARPLDWAKRARKDPLYWTDSVQSIDLGNVEKVICDALEGIAYENDRQVDWMLLRRREPDGSARVVVTIREIDPINPQLDLAQADDPFWQERRKVERSSAQVVAPERDADDDGALFQ